MSSALLARLGDWLLDPGSGLAMPHVQAGPAAEVALLAPPGDVAALAALLALRLTRGTAVVGLWTGRPPETRSGAALALPASRRLAATLTSRGLPAAAWGRVVTVGLPEEGAAAAAAARRLCGAVPGAPVVFGVGGPRDGAWDGLLAGLDLVVVHARESAVGRLAVARLSEQGARAVELDAVPGGAARALARAGLALPGGAAGLPAGLEVPAR